MQQAKWVRVFPIILIFCLAIGTISNLIKSAGPLILLVSMAVLLAARLLAPLLNRLTRRQMLLLLGIGFGLMLGAQLLVLKTMPVTVYHDPFRVLSQADQMAAGDMRWRITYFWRYSNNVSLAYLLSLWLRATTLAHLSTNMSVHLLSLLLLDGFIALLTRTVAQLSHRNTTTLAVFAFCALTPFAYTYFLQVFYSDLPAMLVLLILVREVWLWAQRNVRQKWVHGITLTCTVLLGQLLKPNLIVVLPAVVLLGGCYGLLKRRLAWGKMLPLLLIVLGLGLSVPAGRIIDTAANFTPNTQFAFPTTNWLVMGINQHSHGMYSGKDVARSLKLPNQAARNRANLQIIAHRYQTIGPLKLARLWVTKAGILLNVHGVQSWYNGGYRAAPQWYLAHARTWQTLTAMGYQVAIVCLFVMTAFRLILWRPDLRSRREWVVLFSIIIALGYIAFHVLLWETEQRYGQVLVPLLWLVASGLPVPIKVRHFGWRRPIAGLVLAGGTVVAGIVAAPLIAAQNHQPLIIAAQRSQLSTQYHAAPCKLAAGAVLAETVNVNAHANYFSVQTHNHTHVRVTLTNLATGDVVRLHRAGLVYRTQQHLAAGQYRIWLTNTSRRPQAIDVVATHNYRLAPHPLVINGVQHAHASLIYTVMRKE